MEDLSNRTWPLEISEMCASDVMIARSKVKLINLDWAEFRIKNVVLELNHYTIPVIKGANDNFIGVVKASELVEAMIKGKRPWENIKYYCHPIDGVFETDCIKKVYGKFIKQPIGLISVLDQNREITGIVTAKDIYGLLNSKKYRIAKSRMVGRKYGHGKFKWENASSYQGKVNLTVD